MGQQGRQPAKTQKVGRNGVVPERYVPPLLTATDTDTGHVPFRCLQALACQLRVHILLASMHAVVSCCMCCVPCAPGVLYTLCALPILVVCALNALCVLDPFCACPYIFCGLFLTIRMSWTRCIFQDALSSLCTFTIPLLSHLHFSATLSTIFNHLCTSAFQVLACAHNQFGKSHVPIPHGQYFCRVVRHHLPKSPHWTFSDVHSGNVHSHLDSG